LTAAFLIAVQLFITTFKVCIVIRS